MAMNPGPGNRIVLRNAGRVVVLPLRLTDASMYDVKHDAE